MTLKERVSSIGKTAKVSFAALTLAGGMAAAAPATASASSQSVDSIQASWSCNYTYDYYRIDMNCAVYSGIIRLRSTCAGYGDIYTSWVGVGNWYMWNNCYPYGRSASYIDYAG